MSLLLVKERLWLPFHEVLTLKRSFLALLLLLVFSKPAAAQGRVSLDASDIADILERVFAFSQDSLVPGARVDAQPIPVDVELAASLLRAKARAPIDDRAPAVRSLPARFVKADFFDSWDCPGRSITARCMMKREGTFLYVYDVQANDRDNELFVWVAFSSYRESDRGHLRSVARRLTFKRLDSGGWRFVGAGPYLTT